MVLARWTASAWLLIAMACGLACAQAQELRFQQAEFSISDAMQPPEAGWRFQPLPDSWLHNHPGLSGIAWYRVRFNLESAPVEPMALYVGRVAITGQFWLNGFVLNPDVRFSKPDGPIGDDMSRWPHLLTIPSGLLRAGENVLHIRVHGTSVGGHGLWDVRIGPVEQLRAAWLVRELPQRIIPQALLVLMMAGSIFGLLVWLRERRLRYLHFSVVMVLWTVIVGLWIFPQPALTPKAISVMTTLLYVAFHWTLLDLFYRYSGSDWQWYPRVLSVVSSLALATAVAIILFNGESPHASEQIALANLPTLFLRLLATVMLLQAAWRTHSPRTYALAATELLWFAGHLQIIGVMAGWVAPVPFRFDPASSLPLYLVLLHLFVDRLIREREQAVREQQAAISAERARILQDMHDGMGSQLVMALRVVKREDGDRALVARNIEEALEDMRLIVDSLDSADQGALPKLADLRYRLQPRLANLGISLKWEVQPLAELAGLTPQSALGVLRIVQEALNNAVKHGRPKIITVSATRENGRALIRVNDDGAGFDPCPNASGGRGLSGMQRRAGQLGATFRVESCEGGGTSVTLHLPAPAEKAPAATA